MTKGNAFQDQQIDSAYQNAIHHNNRARAEAHGHLSRRRRPHKVQPSLHEKKGIQTRNRTEPDPRKSILKILQLRSDITVKTKRSFFMIMEKESEIPATLPVLDMVGILTGSIS